MKAELKAKVDLMIENFEELRRGFKFEANLIKHFGALIHATNGKKVNIDDLEKINKFIKQQTGVFSNFRGTNGFVLSNLLNLEDDYSSFFSNMLEVHEKMRDENFRKCTYLPLAVYTITKESSIEQWDYKINRMNEFYQSMKKNHYWLTSYDDYVFAAVLATTDLDIDKTTQNIESCYQYLNKNGFHKGNDLQTLSHVLAIGEESVEQKCNKVVEINKRLIENKCKLSYNGLASLGLLALITSDDYKIVDEIKEVYDYIYSKKGYGFWSLDKSMRTMLAVSLVSDVYVEGINKGVLKIALGNSINAIIIAQQQAIIAGAIAASAASTASASS